MKGPAAKVLLDSVSPTGARLTTMEVTFHRFVLAEFNTHRMFSRNSASSRAIPVEKQLKQFREAPAMPVELPAEQPGMQGGDGLNRQHGVSDPFWNQTHGAYTSDWHDASKLLDDWHLMTTNLIDQYLQEHPEKRSRLHKSVLNRLMEPMMWHTVIVSATDWSGFFEQRCSPLAQPEIRVVAELMRDRYNESVPKELGYGEWHLPMLTDAELNGSGDEAPLAEEVRRKVSVARCARVSYLTHDGLRDIDEDVKLYERLVGAVPMHASPLEHVARPTYLRLGECCTSNFDGWTQYRTIIEGNVK